MRRFNEHRDEFYTWFIQKKGLFNYGGIFEKKEYISNAVFIFVSMETESILTWISLGRGANVYISWVYFRVSRL